MARPVHRPACAAILSLCLVATVFPSCDPAEQSPREIRKRFHIVIVGEAKDDATWEVLQASALKTSQDYPIYDVEVLAPATASPDGQQKILESLISSDASAICVVPTDPDSIAPVIEQLYKRGKPVIVIGRDIQKKSSRRVYCGPSELDIGKTAAIACAQSLAGRSQTVMLLTSDSDQESELIRRRAFREELPAHGNIKIVKEVHTSSSPIDAVSAVRGEVRKYPRTGSWVFFNDAPLRVTASDQRLLPIGCRLVLCDGDPRYLDRLRRGEIQAFVTYDFHLALTQALSAARSLCENVGRDVVGANFIETETISATELDWYEKRWESWKRGRPSPKPLP